MPTTTWSCDRYDGGPPAGSAESVWQECSAELKNRAIATCMGSGNLISFAPTSDGGVLCVSVLQAGRRVRAYPRNGAQLEGLLAEWADWLGRKGYVPDGGGSWRT